MNIQQALIMLQDYLTKNQKNLIIHAGFINDLKKLLKSNLKGNETKFFAKMTQTLDNLITFGNDINTINGHEVLKGCTDKSKNPLEIYSLHIKSSSYNIRFLVMFTENNCPQLLVAFSEMKKTDYKKHIPIAINRSMDLKKEETV